MPFPHETIVKTILDLYTEETKNPVAFVYNNRIYWQSSKEECSSYCKIINTWFPERCHEDHKKRVNDPKNLTICHAGLWNYKVPIKSEGKIIGALLTGQRRLKGRDQDSLEFLTNFKDEISENRYQILRKYFYDTPIIEDFDVDLLQTLEKVAERLFNIIISLDLAKRKILNLAHLFLLPIQSIIANSENIYLELSNENDEMKRQTQDLMEQVIKLGMIAENMRSSMMNENERYHYEDKNILKLIQETINIFKSEALTRDIGIKDIKYTGNHRMILSVSYKDLSRAFFNIYHNSVKYSFCSISDTKKRYVETIISERDKYFSIEIANYGIGIFEDEINQGKIFEDGYRGRLSGDRERTGSGIGLSEAKKIIEKHGGKIRISSKLLGLNEYHGPYKTTVHVKLPKSR